VSDVELDQEIDHPIHLADSLLAILLSKREILFPPVTFVETVPTGIPI
jgi:hypothetical protein